MTSIPGRKMLVDTVGCGLVLWAVGFAVSLILFTLVPLSILGLFVLLLLVPLTILVSYSRLKATDAVFRYYALVGLAWTILAIIMDYVFIVRAFNASGYYDLDVGVYYSLTFLIPMTIGVRFGRAAKH